MKKLILIGLLIPSLAFGQQNAFVRNDDNATTLNGANGRQASASVDSKGVQSVKTVDGSGSGETQSVIPVSNAVNLNGVATQLVGCTPINIYTTASAGTTTTAIITGIESTAEVGDKFVFRSGGSLNNQNVWNTVSGVSTNTLTFANAFVDATQSGVTGYLCRPQLIGSTLASASNSGISGLGVAIQSGFQDSAATGLLKLEDAVAASGDALVAGASVRMNPSSPVTPADAAGDYQYIGSNAYGVLNTDIDFRLQGSAANGILKQEDAAAASGDALVGIAGVANETFTSLAANGDYTPLATDRAGINIGAIVQSGNLAAGPQVAKIEDAAAASGDAGVAMFAKRLTTFNAEAAENDYTLPITDIDQRLAVNAYGADPSEFWQACGTATATTGDTAIKAAVASNRIYTTAITCKNTSATTATSLDFKDGTTIIAVGGISQMATTAPGSFTATFPVPLRGTSNTALNFATNISVSSVTCCATGYISTN